MSIYMSYLRFQFPGVTILLHNRSKTFCDIPVLDVHICFKWTTVIVDAAIYTLTSGAYTEI